MSSETYLGNPRLKSVGQPVEWTEESVLEYKKCMESPEHFIKNYVKNKKIETILKLYLLMRGLFHLICILIKRK